MKSGEHNRRAAVLLITALALLGPEPASAQTPGGKVTNPPPESLLRLLRGVDLTSPIGVGDYALSGMTDHEAIASAILGDTLNDLSDSDRLHFKTVLFELIRQSYYRNLTKLAGHRIELVGEEKKGDATIFRFMVHPQKPGEEPISFAYKGTVVGSLWKIQDIITEDVSLVSSWRSQFRNILKKDGYAVLIRKMQDKVLKGLAEER